MHSVVFSDIDLVIGFIETAQLFSILIYVLKSVKTNGYEKANKTLLKILFSILITDFH